MNITPYTGQPPADLVRELAAQLPGPVTTQAQLLGISVPVLLRCLSPTPPSPGQFRDRQVDVLWAMQQTIRLMSPHVHGEALVRWLTSPHPLLDRDPPVSLITNHTRDSYLGLLHWIAEHGAGQVAEPTEQTPC